MASENNKKLQQAFAPILKAHGFKKDGATWRKFNDETIAVFNIQSGWGMSFYINLGILFREICDNEKPRESQCGIRDRLAEGTPDQFRVEQLLDFSFNVPEMTRLSELEEIVTRRAMPFFDLLSTKAGAQDSLYLFPSAAVTLAALKYLGLPLPA